MSGVQVIQRKLESRRIKVRRLSRPCKPRSKVSAGSKVKSHDEHELEAMWQTVWSVCVARTERLHQLQQQVTVIIIVVIIIIIITEVRGYLSPQGLLSL